MINHLISYFRRRIRRLFICLLIACLVFTVIYFRDSILRKSADFLVYESPLKPAEVVAVLGGGETERIEKAVELFQQGYAHDILVLLPEQIPPEAAYGDLMDIERRICRSVLNLRGVATDRIHWSSEAHYSTYGEIKYIRSWMQSRGYHSLIIVPDLFQSRRAKWTGDRIFRGTGYEISIQPAPNRFVYAANWWTNEEGIITVENEYLKNIYYLIKSTVGEP